MMTEAKREKIQSMHASKFSLANIARQVDVPLETVMDVLGLEYVLVDVVDERDDDATAKKAPAAADVFQETTDGLTGLQDVFIGRIVDNPFQSRLEYNHLQELADDITKNGLMQPPRGRLLDPDGRVLDPDEYGPFTTPPDYDVQLAFGHRRVRACAIASMKFIPVFIQHMTDEQMADIALAENQKRLDPSAVEDAITYQKMMDEFDWTQARLAKHIGVSRSALANKLRLLNLPDSVKMQVHEGWLTEKHGRELLRLLPAGNDRMEWYADQVIKKGDSVADLKQRINSFIHALKPLVTKSMKAKRAFGRHWADPEFPLDWNPLDDPLVERTDEDDPTVLIEGACLGCQLNVQFTGEKHTRCLQTTAHKVNTCFEHKSQLWKVIAKKRDMQEFTAETGIDVQLDNEKTHIFGSYWAEAGLILTGMCGPDQCTCCKAVYTEYGTSEKIPVNADVSDRVVWACSDRKCLDAKLDEYRRKTDDAKQQEMQTRARTGDDLAMAEMERIEKRKQLAYQLAEKEKTAKGQLAEYVDALDDPTDLFHNMGFLRLILEYVGPELRLPRGPGPADVANALFWKFADVRVMKWNHDINHMEWSEPALHEFLNRFSNHDQPHPGDSQQTDWQDGWNEADEGEWLMLCASPVTLTVDDITRQRVALRAIEESDKEARGELWRRYHELMVELEKEMVKMEGSE